MSFQNLSGGISIYSLSIGLGQPTISLDKQTIDIPYRGISDPDSNSVVLLKYQYSVNNGVTYSDMTPVDPSDIYNLAFNAEGNNLVFHWDAKKDIGIDLYNRSIKVVLQATEFGLNSLEVSRSFYFSRSMVNEESERSKKIFPDNYEGLSGYKYKQEKLPKAQ